MNPEFEGTLEGKLLSSVDEILVKVHTLSGSVETEDFTIDILHESKPKNYLELDVDQYKSAISKIDEIVEKQQLQVKEHNNDIVIQKKSSRFVKASKIVKTLRNRCNIQYNPGESFESYCQNNAGNRYFRGLDTEYKQQEFSVFDGHADLTAKIKEKEDALKGVTTYIRETVETTIRMKQTLSLVEQLRTEDIKISTEDVDQYLLMALEGDIPFSRALKEIRTDPSKIEVEFKPDNPPVYTKPAVKKEQYVPKTVDTNVAQFLKNRGIKGAYAKELAERNDITSIMGFMGKLETTMEAFGMDSSEAHPIYTKHKNLLLANGREQERYLDTLATLYVIKDPNNCSGILPRNAKDAYESAQSLRKLLPSCPVIIDSDRQAVPGWRAEKITEMLEKDPFTGKYLDETGIRTMNLALFGNSQKDWLQPEENSHFRAITTHSEKMCIQLTATRNNISVKVINYISNFN